MITKSENISPIISVIIPCYNSEATLAETLESIINQDYNAWEAIIVNDGSTDRVEELALQWVKKDRRFKYYKIENGGLGNARNYGIERSKGTYILPLDSDNTVLPDFSKKAIRVFEKDKTIGVVHGHAQYFGEKTGVWKINPYDYEQILIRNYIDACAIYKKSLWLQVGGYDTEMPHQGHEDWELWLAFGRIKTKFFHLNQITFNYRVSKNSMIKSFSKEMFLENEVYITKKYSQEIFYYFKKNRYVLNHYNENPFKTVFTFLKKWLKSKYVFV